MPRKKTQKRTKQSPQRALQNITNQPIVQNSQFRRKCVVKMPKLAIEKQCCDENGKNGKNLKRKAEGNSEGDQIVNRIKRSTEQPSTSYDEQSVNNLIKKYELLQKVISGKYLTVVERLKLDFVPLCAENIEHCHRKHYKKAAPPKLPSVQQMNLIKNTLQQSRYEIFINLVWDLCQKEQFPGVGVLTSIFKLILTLNPESEYNSFLQSILDRLLWLFDVILRLFPPCWLAVRPSYIKFLKNTIGMSKLVPNKTVQAENTIFEVVLMLLEDTIDISENTRSTRSTRHANNLSNSLMYFDDEYLNMQHWEKFDNEEQTFPALSKVTRLDRLMQVLHLIAKMLEMDLAMWMLRYHKHPLRHIYTDNDQPLVITLFSLSKYTRSSVLTKKIMKLFTLCVEKNIDVHYIKVLERFISLLANTQNLGEIETTAHGISYPQIGPATTSFTMELFKTSGVNMKKDVNTYIRLIEALRCPFLRYEYVDLFLKRLNPAPGKMCPQKIVENFRKERWLECQSADEIPPDSSFSKKHSTVYRHDYLKLLLDALRNYCDLHGTKEFLREVQSTHTQAGNPPEKPNEQRSSSSNNKPIDLSAMRKNIIELEAKVDMSMKLREPRTEFPVVNIRVDSKLFAQYRSDIKYMMILQAYIPALHRTHPDDFSELMKFLKDFAPKY